MKKIIFLIEAGKKVGFGHLGRCLPIYQAFKKASYKVRIYVDSDIEKIQILNNKKYEIINWQKKITNVYSIINSSDLVILDCLSISKKNYNFLLKNSKKLLIIDDRDSRIYNNNEIIADWSILSEKKTHSGNCDFIRGAKYAPLRDCFKIKNKHKIRNKINKILITMGGSDIKDIILPIVDKLKNRFLKINFIVLIVSTFKDQHKIKKLKKVSNVKFIFSPSDKRMVTELRSCDVAIATGGHTIYELASLGVPTIHFLAHKNQSVAEKWKKTGFTYFIGWYNKKKFIKKISNAILKIESPKKRKLMSESGQNLVKPNGSDLLVSKLAKLI